MIVDTKMAWPSRKLDPNDDYVPDKFTAKLDAQIVAQIKREEIENQVVRSWSFEKRDFECRVERDTYDKVELGVVENIKC